MDPAPSLDPVALLYALCFLLLSGQALLVAWKSRRRTRPGLRRAFYLLTLSLLLWQLTLFLEVRTEVPAAQLGLGRANFAAATFAAYYALRFAREIPEGPAGELPGRPTPWLPAVTGLLAALTLLTPLVVAAERVEAGRAITTFGPLFPLYLLHVLGCWLAALAAACRERRRARDPRVRGQLLLVGAGMLATGGIAVITNAVLPYGFGDFRFGDLGTLSTLLFVLAVAYATFAHRLFDLRVAIRKALVYGVLLAFVLGAYGSAVYLVTEHLTEGAGRFVQFAVLMIAFSLDPLRKFLEGKAERLLFGSLGASSRRQSAERKH